MQYSEFLDIYNYCEFYQLDIYLHARNSNSNIARMQMEIA